MEKSPSLLAAFFGTVYGGCFYVPVDGEMPRRRMELILQNTNARYMVCDNATRQDAVKLCGDGIELLCYDECADISIDGETLKNIRDLAIDTAGHI